MARTLENLITEADTVFPDSFISAQFDRGPQGLRPPELLAGYLVAEICDLYGDTSDDRANLTRIITNLEIATEILAEVTSSFRRLRDR